MTIQFKDKTREEFVMRILADLLQNNIQVACFEIDKSGIYLRVMDRNKTILIDVNLEAENFNIFRFKKSEKVSIGLNFSHFHKMLQTVKKNDSIEFYTDDEHPNEFFIKIIPTDNNTTSTSTINILFNVQSSDIDLPGKYDNPVLVCAKDYQKMIKDMAKIDDTVLITSEGFQIKFACDADGIMKKVVSYGEIDSDNEDDEDDNKLNSVYSEKFSSEQLTRISKLSGFSSNIQIYSKENLPLLFKSHVGQLGHISIYIKSKEQIRQETEYSEDEQDY